MSDAQTRRLIEKLRRLTVARGATPHEAEVAKKKADDLEARLHKPDGFVKQKVYVEGWPGQPKCEHVPSRTSWEKSRTLVCKKCGCLYHPEHHAWKSV